MMPHVSAEEENARWHVSATVCRICAYIMSCMRFRFSEASCLFLPGRKVGDYEGEKAPHFSKRCLRRHLVVHVRDCGWQPPFANSRVFLAVTKQRWRLLRHPRSPAGVVMLFVSTPSLKLQLAERQFLYKWEKTGFQPLLGESANYEQERK